MVKPLSLLCCLVCMSDQVFSQAGYGEVVREASVHQQIDDFSWSSQPDPAVPGNGEYRDQGRLAGSRMDIGGGEGEWSLEMTPDQTLLLSASGQSGSSWVGRAWSTSQTFAEKGLVLDFQQSLSSLIRQEWQPVVTHCYIRLRGSGTIKVQLKDPAGEILKEWSSVGRWGQAFEELRFGIDDPESLARVKEIVVVAESPSRIELDEIGLVLDLPGPLAGDDLVYALVTTYASLLRGFDAGSGLTRDHTHWEAGRFDSVPAVGFQALAAAVALDCDILDRHAADAIFARSVAALAKIPTHNGLLPHWLADGEPHEWSTVDTSLALVSALLAAVIMERTEEEYLVLEQIDRIDWEALINARGRVAHGYEEDLSLLFHDWSSWDGEGAVVQLCALLQDPGRELFPMDVVPIHEGVGMVAELAGLFARPFALGNRIDSYGVDWTRLRQEMLAGQRDYFPKHFPGSLAARSGLYGLSYVEIIDAHGNARYLTTGIRPPGGQPDSSGGWVAPHYAAMAGTVDLAALDGFLASLRGLNLLQPLIGMPESIYAANRGNSPERWHSGQISINAFFSFMGLYHAWCLREGRTDLVYQAAASHPRFQAALARLFMEYK